jgi:hypothetical protein
LQHTAEIYCPLQCDTLLCSIQCNILPATSIHCSSSFLAMCCTALHCTALHCTALHYIAALRYMIGKSSGELEIFIVCAIQYSERLDGEYQWHGALISFRLYPPRRIPRKLQPSAAAACNGTGDQTHEHNRQVMPASFHTVGLLRGSFRPTYKLSPAEHLQQRGAKTTFSH